MKGKKEVKILPMLGEQISVPGAWIGIDRELIGTVIEVNILHNYYVLQFECVKGTWRAAFRPGGSSWGSYKHAPHETYVRRFRHKKPAEEEKI